MFDYGLENNRVYYGDFDDNDDFIVLYDDTPVKCGVCDYPLEYHFNGRSLLIKPCACCCTPVVEE